MKINLIRNIRCRKIRKRRRRRDYRNTPPYSHCRNCNTELAGHYCHRCGQFASDVNPSVFKFIRQYFENTYQFDGRLIVTLRYLFTRPGFLSKEFTAGRIVSYVNPLKLYLFVSIFFFGFILVFFTLRNMGSSADKGILSWMDEEDRQEVQLQRQIDSIETALRIQLEDEFYVDFTPPDENEIVIREIIPADTIVSLVGLPEERKESSSDVINKAYDNLGKMTARDVVRLIFNYFSIAMLFLMPLYALILRYQYRKKSKVYVHHFVFSLHWHIILFLLFSIMIVVTHYTGASWFFNYIVLPYLIIYGIIAARTFYGEKWWRIISKSIFGFLLYFFLSFIVLILVLLISLLGMAYVPGI